MIPVTREIHKKAEANPALGTDSASAENKNKKTNRLHMGIGFSENKPAGSAIVGDTPLDPKLCVPVFRRVCPFQFGLYKRTLGFYFFRMSK